MLTKKQKKEILNNLIESFKKAKGAYLANFFQLKTKDLNSLRQQIKEKGGKSQVVKNSLLKLALKKLGQSKEEIENLKGQTLVNFAFEDPVIVPNILEKFIKEGSNLKIIGGFLENQWVDESAIKRIAQIPSREVLFGKLVSSLKAPLFRLAFSLKNNPTKLIFILKNVSQQKGEK
ncbi:MAG: 50S ribosomal protein L10 [Candidatus Paceibacterota bacterium]